MSDETIRTYFSEALFPLFKSDQPDPTKLTTEAWARMERNLADNLASSRMSAAFSLSRSRIAELEAEITKLHAELAALTVANVPPKHDETPVLADDKPKPPAPPNPFREFPVDHRRIGAWHAT